jgi:hypothetical protein
MPENRPYWDEWKNSPWSGDAEGVNPVMPYKEFEAIMIRKDVKKELARAKKAAADARKTLKQARKAAGGN